MCRILTCFSGSHDSFTYWVDVHAPVGPDQKPYVKYLATMFSVLAKKVMVKWSMTQVLIFTPPYLKQTLFLCISFISILCIVSLSVESVV